MKDLFINIAMYAIRFFFRVFWILPLQNRVVFYPINGNYYCNLKYIFESLMQCEKLKFECVWITRGTSSGYPKNVKRVYLYSIRGIYYLMTSKVILFNCGFLSYIPKRKRQIFIETWHGGGAYKRCNKGFVDNPNVFEKKRRYMSINETDYYVAACGKFMECMNKDVGDNVPYVFIKTGMPRNDVFFDDKKVLNLSSKVKKFYKIPSGKSIVLYAPTFRGEGVNIDLKIEEVINELNKRFNKEFVFMIRMHPHIKEKKIFVDDIVIDATEYPDMQEILCATDVLITDYSSSIWDYSFLYRPCFIYASDLLEYQKKHLFFTPITEWPFSLAVNNNELLSNIRCFNSKKYIENLKNHQNELQSFENGDASYQLSNLICNQFD